MYFRPRFQSVKSKLLRYKKVFTNSEFLILDCCIVLYIYTWVNDEVKEVLGYHVFIISMCRSGADVEKRKSFLHFVQPTMWVAFESQNVLF